MNNELYLKFLAERKAKVRDLENPEQEDYLQKLIDEEKARLFKPKKEKKKVVPSKEDPIKKKERNARYRAKHPEKVKSTIKRYAEKHREKLRLKAKEYREKNKDKIAEYKKQYYQAKVKKKVTKNKLRKNAKFFPSEVLDFVRYLVANNIINPTEQDIYNWQVSIQTK